MARAMPVISISRPRNTNSGTASSTRLLMPSSMRETTMVSGTRVTVARNASVAVPNAKPIGTPSSTPAPSRPTKKTSRFQLPIATRAGDAKYSAAATAASNSATSSMSRISSRSSRNAQPSSMMPQPTGMAPARTILDQPSAGVSMNHSSAA